MSYDPILDSDIAAGGFIRQGFGRKTKDNLADHQARLSRLETQTRLFDHFQHNNPVRSFGNPEPTYTKNLYNPDTGGTTWNSVGPLWEYLENIGPTGSSVGAGDCPKPDYSSGRLTVSGAPPCWSAALSRLRLNFSKVSAPLVFEARVKWRGTGAGLVIGMVQTFLPNGGAVQPHMGYLPGIYLSTPNSTQGQFRCFNGASVSLGALWGKKSQDAWFTVRIEMQDSPGVRALTYLDGALVDQFTQYLPTNVNLGACLVVGKSSGSNYWVGTGISNDLEVDRVEFGCEAISDAA
jgi:hypothetical protein